MLQNIVFAALVHSTSAILPHALAFDAGDMSGGALALLGLLSPNVALRFFFQSLHDTACTCSLYIYMAYSYRYVSSLLFRSIACCWAACTGDVAGSAHVRVALGAVSPLLHAVLQLQLAVWLHLLLCSWNGKPRDALSCIARCSLFRRLCAVRVLLICVACGTLAQSHWHWWSCSAGVARGRGSRALQQRVLLPKQTPTRPPDCYTCRRWPTWPPRMGPLPVPVPEVSPRRRRTRRRIS